MVGQVPAREDEAAGLTGARGDFVASFGRRLEAFRGALRSVEQNPTDGALRNGLLRRIHALSSAAHVLGFASAAEALTEAEKRLRSGEFSDMARSLELLPSLLLLGVPGAPRANADRAPTTWPLSVLIFGAQSLEQAIQAIPGTNVECERTEDLRRAREQARTLGPDLAVIDSDCSGARELVEAFVNDPQIEPVPLLVVGSFTNTEAVSAYIALGAARVLAKPVSTEALQHSVVELRALTAGPRGREPLGELSIAALADRIALEVRRGLLDAAEPAARSTSVEFGDGADVMAAVSGAVARVRELVTLRSSGEVRFDSGAPEGAPPIEAWSLEERRAGERGAGGNEARSADQVSLRGRRIVIADDDPAVVWFMSGLLKGLGAEVLEAHDGARALALTYDVWPDLVVSDVLMPKLDGFSLCHAIKRDVAVRDVPVILLSWKEDLLQRVRELGADADGYLRKETAASTVAERLREVLRQRARVEQRIAAGGAVRGRLDGLTPRLILELASAGERDVRVGIRDAVYLYEVQVRRGRLCSATRSSADGSFERGEFILAGLLGVSVGRFTVEPDATPCRADFEGTAAEILKAPIERARSALNSISAAALVGVSRVQIATDTLDGYLACTPEPARSLLDKLILGASPRELISSGSVAPRLLEAVLSDLARRGAITSVVRFEEPAPLTDSALSSASSAPAAEGSRAIAAPKATLPTPTPTPIPIPATPAAPAAPTPTPIPAASASLATPTPVPAATAPAAPTRTSTVAPASSAVSSPAAVSPPAAPVEKSRALPFSIELTPAVDRRWEKFTEGVFSDPGTLQGVGLPAVARSPSILPAPIVSVPAVAADPQLQPTRSEFAPTLASQPGRVAELDALASALTEPSPDPVPVAAVASTTASGFARPVTPPATSVPEHAASSPPSAEAPATGAQPSFLPAEPEAPKVAATRVSALKTPTPPARVPVARNAAAAPWLIQFLFVAGAAFAVAYFVVSYYRMQSAPDAGAPPSAPAPATS